MAKTEKTVSEVENNTATATDAAAPETVAKSEYDALFNQAQNIINNLNSQVAQLQSEVKELKSDKIYLKGYIDSLISEKTATTDSAK